VEVEVEMELKILEVKNKRICCRYRGYLADGFVEGEKIFNNFKEFVNWLRLKWGESAL